jgi:Fe-Mn family superoxide dismutase
MNKKSPYILICTFLLMALIADNAYGKDSDELTNPMKSSEKAPFALPALPYDAKSLEPHISEKTLNFHHGKHQQAYVDKLNDLVKGTELESKTLEEIIMATAKDESKQGIFNNAAQVWNHTFYWNSMKSGGGGKPQGKLAAQIDKDFGSYEKFKEQLKQTGVTQFGSGWAWLVLDKDKLKVIKTSNADLPMVHGQRALLAIDVWEHAYYLDYQNRRPDYITIFLDQLVNWSFAESNFNMKLF